MDSTSAARGIYACHLPCIVTGCWMLGLDTSFSTFSTTACMSSVDYGADFAVSSEVEALAVSIDPRASEPCSRVAFRSYMLYSTLYLNAR